MGLIAMILMQYLSLLVITLLFSRSASARGELPPSISRQRISLGKVLPGDALEHVLYFTNPSERPLNVINIQLTPPLIARNITRTVEPGGTGQFIITLDNDPVVGQYHGSVQLEFREDDVGPTQYLIDAFFVPAVEFRPYPAFFVATDLGHQETATIEVINHQQKPLQIMGIRHESDRFDMSVETLVPGHHYQVTLTLNGKMSGEKLSEWVYLLMGKTGSETVKLQANTWIRERVYTFPEKVDMGRLPHFVTRDARKLAALAQTVMVYRKETDDFDISVSTDLDCIEIHSQRGPDGDRYQLTVTLIPGKTPVGEFSGHIYIRTNDTEISELTVPIRGCIFERDRRNDNDRRGDGDRRTDNDRRQD